MKANRLFFAFLALSCCALALAYADEVKPVAGDLKAGAPTHEETGFDQRALHLARLKELHKEMTSEISALRARLEEMQERLNDLEGDVIQRSSANTTLESKSVAVAAEESTPPQTESINQSDPLYLQKSRLAEVNRRLGDKSLRSTEFDRLVDEKRGLEKTITQAEAARGALEPKTLVEQPFIEQEKVADSKSLQ